MTARNTNFEAGNGEINNKRPSDNVNPEQTFTDLVVNQIASEYAKDPKNFLMIHNQLKQNADDTAPNSPDHLDAAKNLAILDFGVAKSMNSGTNFGAASIIEAEGVKYLNELKPGNMRDALQHVANEVHERR